MPYLFNESGQYRSLEFLQGVGFVQAASKNGVEVCSKMEPGPGDMYIHENDNYVLIDLKSANLSDTDLKRLILKTIANTKKVTFV